MPSYEVIAKGYGEDNRLYDPKDKNANVYHREKAYAKGKVPSWLKPIKSETAAEKKKRIAAEKKKAEQVADDQKDIEKNSVPDFGGKSESVTQTL